MGSARSISRSGLREWRPSERREDDSVRQQPWLEAPSPYEYRPLDPPRAETQESEEESARVIIIEM